MIRAWRLTDGRYRLDFDPRHHHADRQFNVARRSRALGGRWEIRAGMKELVVPEKALVQLGVEKVFGVITGPSSCGCEPLMFRWVTESEVRAGKTELRACPECSWGAEPPGRTSFHHCDIIEVMGEADVAEAVYEAEFTSHFRQ